MAKLSEAQRRAALSSSGKDLLRRADAWQQYPPIGNCNLSQVLQFVAWGWIDGDGTTEAGRAALSDSESSEHE